MPADADTNTNGGKAIKNTGRVDYRIPFLIGTSAGACPLKNARGVPVDVGGLGRHTRVPVSLVR